MLKTQRQISFKGGIESAKVTKWDAEQMKTLHIKDIWLACDTKNKLIHLQKAVKLFRDAGFYQKEILRCYVLIGDDMQENESRLRQIFALGVLPFAQLYQPKGSEKKKYSREWEAMQRTWQRPAAMKAHIKSIIKECC